MVRLIGTTEKDNKVLLYYSYTKQAKHFFKYVISEDGYNFTGDTKYIIITDQKGREDVKYEFDHFNITDQNEHYAVCYKSTSSKN